MAAVPDALPYGLRQIRLTPYTDAQGTALGNTSYPLPVAMTLGFSETEQYDELRGDDVLVAVHGRGAQVDWSLEAGGISITAWSIVSGAAVIEEGVAPTRKTRLRKSGDDQRPYFRIDGRAISDSGGSMVTRIYRAKANGRLQADLRGGAFQTSRIDGVGLPMIGDAGRWLYEFIRQEHDASIPGTPEANPLPVPINLEVKSIIATGATLDWDAVGGFVNPTDKYYVEISIDQGVTWTHPTALAGGEPVTDTSVLTGLTTATAYQARVAYWKNGTVKGDPSRVVTFTTA
jgi:hypothetical protein